jgi:hypothetical protein
MHIDYLGIICIYSQPLSNAFSCSALAILYAPLHFDYTVLEVEGSSFFLARRLSKPRDFEIIQTS